MKRALLGVTALALVATLATACTERSDRVGERPGDRTPSASPPTALPPPPTAMPSTPSTPSDTTTSGAPSSNVPSATPSAPDSAGTK